MTPGWTEDGQLVDGALGIGGHGRLDPLVDEAIALQGTGPHALARARRGAVANVWTRVASLAGRERLC